MSQQTTLTCDYCGLIAQRTNPHVLPPGWQGYGMRGASDKGKIQHVCHECCRAVRAAELTARQLAIEERVAIGNTETGR